MDQSQLPEEAEQQQPASAYDEIAEWYDDSVKSSSLIHDLVLPALFDLIGNVEGRRVCDLACGQGVVARHLAKGGAAVVGVDTSARLLDIAQRYEAEEPLGIVSQHDDAQALATLPDTAFDGVACNMALMDIPDVAATFRAVHRILRPDGWFVFSITHPWALRQSQRCAGTGRRVPSHAEHVRQPPHRSGVGPGAFMRAAGERPRCRACAGLWRGSRRTRGAVQEVVGSYGSGRPAIRSAV